jgi:hypothetical protein
VVQCVFQHGRLIGGHCYQARAQGVGGSARARISVSHPVVLEHMARLGAHLNWHGALTLDYMYDAASGVPRYIDANPRLGETLNATMSGVNLADLLVQVSLGHTVEPVPPSRPGVKTHSTMMSLMAAAEAGKGRHDLLAELEDALTGRGLYAGSQDEITQARSDPLSLIPAAVVCLRLLCNPRAVRRIVNGTVENYSLNEAAVRAIRALSSGPARNGLGS